MKSIHLAFVWSLLVLLPSIRLFAQDDEPRLKLSGSLLTDQRFLLPSPHYWAWNENRLTLKLGLKITSKSKFYSEVWLRNMGIPKVSSSADLFNKGIVDPYNIEIREAYVQLFGFLSKNLDIKIGKQRIAWGTADMFNPTDNLNPYDLEDVLDFGRHRGSVAITLDYYFNNEFSLEGVYIPLFQPDDLPVGIFADALQPSLELPPPFTLKGYEDEAVMPPFTLSQSSITGLKFKGFAGGIDFSFSYVWGRDGLPITTYNTISPGDSSNSIFVSSQSSFTREHIFGADMATSVIGVGLWAEAAMFLPAYEVIMTTDLSDFFPNAPGPVTTDSLVLKKEPYVKFIIGADYHFANSMYVNFQYLHGFVNERGQGNLNDYFFLQYEMRFFEDRLKITPLAGGFIVSDWKKLESNYSIIYAPGLTYMATDNAELTFSTPLFFGKGDDIFAKFTDYNMLMFRFKYSF